ncbi:hypothetical protein GCM10009805_08770 [Leucobacter chromiireducens subsp. solipictus]
MEAGVCVFCFPIALSKEGRVRKPEIGVVGTTALRTHRKLRLHVDAELDEPKSTHAFEWGIAPRIGKGEQRPRKGNAGDPRCPVEAFREQSLPVPPARYIDVWPRAQSVSKVLICTGKGNGKRLVPRKVEECALRRRHRKARNFGDIIRGQLGLSISRIGTARCTEPERHEVVSDL